jgi:FkbM family methyltransferase
MRISQFMFHSFAESAFCRQGIAFDLGANHGQFATYLARHFRRVVAVEPNPNISLDNLPQNIEVLRCAIGWPKGRQAFHFTEVDDASAIIENASEITNETLFTVDLISLADLFSPYQTDRISFVKMDIEGAEVDLLLHEDASVLQRIDQLTVEFHDFLDTTQSPRVLEVIARMKTLGFHALVFTFKAHGDVLFINKHSVNLRHLEMIWTQLRYKWFRGCWRNLSRRLGKDHVIPGGYKFLR